MDPDEVKSHESAGPEDQKIYESIAANYFADTQLRLHFDTTSSGARLTLMKSADICASHGFEVSGFVLCHPDGRRCLVEKSAVRWLSNEEMWDLMHPVNR